MRNGLMGRALRARFVAIFAAMIWVAAFAYTRPGRAAGGSSAAADPYGRLTRSGIVTDDAARLAGNWSGDSICLDRQSACHDEKVVYRISLYPNDATRVKVQGDKIVNGQPVRMGIGDYNWDEKKNTLTHEDQFGAWKIAVKGNTMDGMMTSPAGTPFRHLTLKKDG